jgi:hypothetical protein
MQVRWNDAGRDADTPHPLHARLDGPHAPSLELCNMILMPSEKETDADRETKRMQPCVPPPFRQPASIHRCRLAELPFLSHRSALLFSAAVPHAQQQQDHPRLCGPHPRRAAARRLPASLRLLTACVCSNVRRGRPLRAGRAESCHVRASSARSTRAHNGTGAPPHARQPPAHILHTQSPSAGSLSSAAVLASGGSRVGKSPRTAGCSWVERRLGGGGV